MGNAGNIAEKEILLDQKSCWMRNIAGGEILLDGKSGSVGNLAKLELSEKI